MKSQNVRTWAEGRRRKLLNTRFLIFASLMTVILSYPYWAQDTFGDRTPANLIKLLAVRFSGIGYIIDEPWFNAWSKSHDFLALSSLMIFVSFLLAWFCPLDSFHDRFLIEFNHDVLTPIDRLHIDSDRSEDSFVQLAWMPGEGGPRNAAWNDLRNWCDDCMPAAVKAGTSPIFTAVLVGRSGSGKSRMAHSFARTLARRDQLGGGRTNGALSGRIGVYIRRVAPFMRPRHDDPWDAGLLARRDQDTGFDEVCSRLSLWAPRVPTLLVLDDPIPGWSQMVRKILVDANGKKPFKHVVCLLIVNQTIPTEFDFDPSSHLWTFEKHVLTPQPILLPAAAWFTPEETLKAAFTSGHLLGRSLEIERKVRENLYDITQGNPLLVVLAIEWIRNGRPIDEMTANELVRHRAKRILAGLEHRSIRSDPQLAALAIATLVGGAPRDRIHAAVERIFGGHSSSPESRDLRGCFPTEPLAVGSAVRIPAVRPNLVADAFVDCVLEQIGADRAIALAEASFRLDPGAMLRSLRRPRPRDSHMTTALGTIDPAQVPGLDPVDLALALADVAVICRVHDLPLSTAESRAEARDRVLSAIDRLSQDQKAAFCQGFASLLDLRVDQREEQHIRPREAMQLICRATDGGGGPVLLRALSSCFAHLERLGSGSIDRVDPLHGVARGVTSVDLLERAAQSAWSMGHDWRLALSPFWRGLSETCGEIGLPAERLRFLAMAGLSHPEVAKEAADAAADLAALSADDVVIHCEAAQARKCEAYAWCQVPDGAQAPAARAAADVVRDIAARFPDDPAIQREAAEARRCEAYAWCRVPAGAQAPAARAAADVVRDIAARFPDDPAIQREAAEARQCEAYAWCQVPAGAQAPAARAAADVVRDIADRFPDDPEIQSEAAQARKCEAYAWCQVPAGAQAPAARAATDVVRDIAARFPDDPAIQREAAQARRCEADAWSEVPAGVQAPAARAAADVVRDIAARFPDDPAIQREAAEARRCEAYAWCQVPAGAQAPAARAAADVVRDIADRFPDDPEIQSEAAQARKCEAYAWCQVPAGAQAPAARAAADVVRDIAARFPDDPAIQREAAEARRCEAYAWCRVPAGAQAPAARAAADVVRDIAARFPDDPAIQREAAEARQCEAYAWCQVPAGAQAPAARAAADVVRDIAARFPDDPAIQCEAAEARRCEAYAWSEVPAGAQAPAARAAADVVRDIAARFPDEPAIQHEAAQARRCEAYAWCQVPAGAQAPAARAAADVVRDIAARFPDDPAIQSEVNSVWETVGRLRFS